MNSKISGKPIFSNKFKKTIKSYKKVRYDIDSMTVCMPGCKAHHGLSL